MFLGALGASACVTALSACTTLGISPRPTAALIRLGFDKGGQAMSDGLAKHVPDGISQMLDLRYDPTDDDALLDVFYPARVDNTLQKLPVVVWVHGGAWVSGDKGQIANYLRILASQGYTTVGVNYSIAPRKIYPEPLRQVNTALAYLQANAARLHVDRHKIFLAGDSAGAQIAAQLANIISDPSYARAVGIEPTLARAHLRGTLLYCGAYDLAHVNLNGPLGPFLKTVLWAYAGERDFINDPRFEAASVARHLTPAFPPTFITAGNSDPLELQSHEMAQALARQNVAVDSVFYPPEHTPKLGHEYQFNLDNEDGQQVLQRSVRFMARWA